MQPTMILTSVKQMQGRFFKLKSLANISHHKMATSLLNQLLYVLKCTSRVSIIHCSKLKCYHLIAI